MLEDTVYADINRTKNVSILAQLFKAVGKVTAGIHCDESIFH